MAGTPQPGPRVHAGVINRARRDRVFSRRPSAIDASTTATDPRRARSLPGRRAHLARRPRSPRFFKTHQGDCPASARVTPSCHVGGGGLAITGQRAPQNPYLGDLSGPGGFGGAIVDLEAGARATSTRLRLLARFRRWCWSFASFDVSRPAEAPNPARGERSWHFTGKYIQWHPGGGHHGPDPYWKVSSPQGGTVRVGAYNGN